jgi:phenylacetate-CoA ligase
MKSPISAFLNEFRHTQFQSREWLVAYQRGLLEPLLRHARENVAFYRDTKRLDPLFRGDGSIEWERWKEIPLLSRKDVQQNFEALQAGRLGPEHGRTWTSSTSGSTGEPVRVVLSLVAARIVWAAQLLRDLERHQIDPRRRLAYLSPWVTSIDSTAQGPNKNFWFPPFEDLELRGERFDLTDTRPATELIERLVAIRPNYLRVQPIVLQLICANDRERRLADLGIEAVVTVGEHFPFEAKREVSLHLGCRIMDHYASQECGRIATTCPMCTRFHVDAEANVVEIVDDGGGSTAPGGTGWIVVTPLYHYAMPLIRYDHADKAVAGVPDECAIKLPVLDAVLGKERDPFVFPDGSTIRPTVSTNMVIRNLGAQSYQIAQVASDCCEVRIVPGGLRPEEMRLDEMTRHLQAIWWKRLKIEYKIVEEIPRRSMRGKIPLFVNEVGKIAQSKRADHN